MYTGGKNIIKPKKTKFKKEQDSDDDIRKLDKKNKKRDKATYRLHKEEREYV
jgi:hypothetical protein